MIKKDYKNTINEKKVTKFLSYMNEELKNEIFHIIHSAILYINEGRDEENKILILDKEVWDSIPKIDIGELFKFLEFSS